MRFLKIVIALLPVLPMTAAQAWMLSRPKKSTKPTKTTISPSVVYSFAEASGWPFEPVKSPVKQAKLSVEIHPSASKMNETCSQCLMTDGWVPDARHGSVLQCSCRTWYGWYHTAYFLLSKKVGNDNGRLVWNSSDYFWTCDNQEIVENHILRATCARSDGARPVTTLDLDNYIQADRDGQLQVRWGWA
ncbi:hypothetical protein MAPG_09206 [Magnaporthiopsis poae ATCC 64411]|uniref:Cyanovirin-N domain-containing protein n=1 Tax=Magnaporthiopsis poae (strain ATCC 64411 / 73-15) TaxID=644358 RepID=A0A0C4E9C6_MAGP6|nr:hypothetical protein MAPG_09206 [Magnaporthiopsis poae ATCC 64411]